MGRSMVLVADFWLRRPGFGSKKFNLWYVEEKCGTVIGFCLSTSGLPYQYYSAHAVYTTSSNVIRNRRTNGQVLETFKKNDGLNTWSPDTLEKVIIINRGNSDVSLLFL
jgi:hypothetical protein